MPSSDPMDIGDPPVLPTGQVIDAKNTLQSFDGSPMVLSSKPVDSEPFNSGKQPLLPSGKVIDAKNTLQSFATSPEAMEEGAVPTVYAVAVEDMSIPIVNANIDMGMVKEPQSTNTTPDSDNSTSLNISSGTEAVPSKNETLLQDAPRSSKWKRFVTFRIGICIAIAVIALAFGLIFGLKNDDRSSDESIDIPDDENTLFDDPEAALTNFVNNVTLSNQNITTYGEISENLAFKWMLGNLDKIFDNTTDLLSLDPSTDNAIGFRVKQLFPLLVMWFQSDKAATWANSSGWLEDPNECNWYGISCRTTDLGSTIGSQEVITNFSLVGGSAYVGTLPADIGLLTHLESFQIRGTEDYYHLSLRGTIPETVGRWRALTSFDVAGNLLIGTLPENIGQWTSLTTCDVSGNLLNGTIPESIGNWVTADYVQFHVNQFVGTVPDSICAFIKKEDGDILTADCLSSESVLNCSCCTDCYY